MRRKRPARVPLPLATLALAGTIVGAFSFELGGDGVGLCQRFGFVPAYPTAVSALTSLFLHDPSGPGHVGGNLVVLLLVGSGVERAIGSVRFAALYVAGGLAGAALHVVVDSTSTIPLVGASGSLFALLAIAAKLFGPAMLAFAAVLVVTNVWHAFGGPGDEGVAFACHLGGFAVGSAVIMLAWVRGVDMRRTAA
jgi:membrane associated rhomboid family serine protease